MKKALTMFIVVRAFFFSRSSCGKKKVRSHPVTGNQSSGLKSHLGDYSFAPVVLRSSAWAIRYCKFREGKVTGRNV